MSPFITAQNLQELPASVTIEGGPDTCPICHKGIRPISQGLDALNERTEGVERVFRCPREVCQGLFIAYYFRNRYSGIYFYKASLPLKLQDRKFSDELKEISADYCSICNEAHKAELMGYSQVCGPGYRKALEFLVKDFVSRGKNEEEKKEIEDLPLASCIKKYVDDARLKAVAERAVWLGNDETHYVRKWEDKDLNASRQEVNPGGWAGPINAATSAGTYLNYRTG